MTTLPGMWRAGLAIVATAFVLAAPAQAAIVPQQGIGGAVVYTYPTVQVTFFGGPAARVTSVTTRSAAQRTARGVGVGRVID